jgi:hypothetical protein
MVTDEDWALRFLERFAAMSESDRDAAIDALSPEDRDALLALADARTRTADADPLEVLDAGQAGLERLYEVTQPADLLAMIELAAAERPALVVEVLFAAVVLHRGSDEGEPRAVVELREQWHRHVHALVDDARRRDDG